MSKSTKNAIAIIFKVIYALLVVFGIVCCIAWTVERFSNFDRTTNTFASIDGKLTNVSSAGEDVYIFEARAYRGDKKDFEFKINFYTGVNFTSHYSFGIQSDNNYSDFSFTKTYKYYSTNGISFDAFDKGKATDNGFIIDINGDYYRLRWGVRKKILFWDLNYNIHSFFEDFVKVLEDLQTGDYVLKSIDFTNYFEIDEYNQDTTNWEKSKNDHLYIPIKVYISDGSIVTARQSMFNIYKGDSNYNKNDVDYSVHISALKPKYVLDEKAFTVVEDIETGYLYYKLKQEYVDSLMSQEDYVINVKVFNFGGAIRGFAENCFKGINVTNIYIEGQNREVFEFLKGSLKDTGIQKITYSYCSPILMQGSFDTMPKVVEL